MTYLNRAASRINWDKAAGPSELEAAWWRGRSAIRTAALAAFAFAIGALTASAVHIVREDAPRTLTLPTGSLAPAAVATAAKPATPEAAELAFDSAAEEESMRLAATGPDDALPVRQIRDVTVEPNVDPAALSQHRILVAHTAVDPALAVREAGFAYSELEGWVAAWQDDGTVLRPEVQPSHDTPAVPAPKQADLMASAPPELPSASSEPVVASTSARIRRAVNLRSGPNKRTKVIGVLPVGAPVQVVSCDGWCEVVYNKRRGFIYQTFLHSLQ
jgi:hypothetical protein